MLKGKKRAMLFEGSKENEENRECNCGLALIPMKDLVKLSDSDWRVCKECDKDLIEQFKLALAK